MNEHQLDYNSDFHNQDFASEQQHLSPDLMEDYNQDSLTDLNTDQPWEQPDQTDYTQSEFNAAEDYYSSGYDAMEMQGNSYSSDLSDLNSSHDTIQYDSASYEQSTYSVEHNSFDNALDTQDYNNNLWEQQYQEQSVMSSSDVTSTEQRSGHEPTAEDLAKSDSLRDDAHRQDLKYQSESNWTEFYDKHDNDGMADLHNKWAGQHLQKKEELLDEANKLEGKE
jgi:hypothetical protein